jgi:hypothetical protein
MPANQARVALPAAGRLLMPGDRHLKGQLDLEARGGWMFS